MSNSKKMSFILYKTGKGIKRLLLTIAKGIIELYVIPQLRSNIRERKKLETKLRHFSPVIKETFWGNHITWVEREKPLTDEQLKKYQ